MSRDQELAREAKQQAYDAWRERVDRFEGRLTCRPMKPIFEQPEKENDCGDRTERR
jgi:hypothetical protein